MVTDADGEIATELRLTNASSKGRNGGRTIPMHRDIRAALVALRGTQWSLHARPTVVPFIVLVISVVLFRAFAGSQFFDPFNLSLILQQVTIIAILGTAQTLIMLTAGIDLSVGAIMILSSVLMARLAVLAGVPVEIAFTLGLLCGVACGFVNGALVAYCMRLAPAKNKPDGSTPTLLRPHQPH